MTPAQYMEIRRVQEGIIRDAERRMADAHEAACECAPPKERRPAKAGDIVEGAIIWHERLEEHGGDYWNIVEEPMHYGDPFRAYRADDGCRYGLQGAYVEVDQ